MGASQRQTSELCSSFATHRSREPNTTFVLKVLHYRGGAFVHCFGRIREWHRHQCLPLVRPVPFIASDFVFRTEVKNTSSERFPSTESASPVSWIVTGLSEGNWCQSRFATDGQGAFEAWFRQFTIREGQRSAILIDYRSREASSSNRYKWLPAVALKDTLTPKPSSYGNVFRGEELFRIIIKASARWLTVLSLPGKGKCCDLKPHSEENLLPALKSYHSAVS